MPARAQRLPKQLWWYFGVLVAIYVIALAVFWPPPGQAPSANVFLVLMYAPAIGALAAHFVAGARIQWGWPNWWILAAFVPATIVLGVDLAAAALGWVQLVPGLLIGNLIASPMAIGMSALLAFGEELGWRGFLWPTLRRRYGFYQVSAVVAVVWLIFHVPLMLFGWYGSISGLPAFAVGLVGAVLFAGVLTDRSRSVWPSVFFHGTWNALVATSFASKAKGACL